MSLDIQCVNCGCRPGAHKAVSEPVPQFETCPPTVRPGKPKKWHAGYWEESKTVFQALPSVKEAFAVAARAWVLEAELATHRNLCETCRLNAPLMCEPEARRIKDAAEEAKAKMFEMAKILGIEASDLGITYGD